MFQSYSGGLPSNLALLTVFDSSAQTAANAVNKEAAPSLEWTIVDSTLPAPAPPAGEQVSVAIDGVTEHAKLGANGFFSLDFPTQNIHPGSFIIQYSYKGDALFGSANDNNTALTVSPAATASTVESTATPAGYNTSVTFTATVSNQNSTPAGAVTFYDGTTALNAGSLLVNGKASLATSSLSRGDSLDHRCLHRNCGLCDEHFGGFHRDHQSDCACVFESDAFPQGEFRNNLDHSRRRSNLRERDPVRHGEHHCQWCENARPNQRGRQLLGLHQPQRVSHRQLPDHLLLRCFRKLHRGKR